jgi:hypothetical protein
MRAVQSFFFLCGVLLASSSTLVHGSPINPNLPIPQHLAFPTPTVSASAIVDRSVVKKDLVDLRILNLGASIVWGLKSSDNNGYEQQQGDFDTIFKANSRV